VVGREGSLLGTEPSEVARCIEDMQRRQSLGEWVTRPSIGLLVVGLLAIPGTARAKPFSVMQTTITSAGTEDTLTMRPNNHASRHLTFTLIAKPRVDFANPPTSLGPEYLVTTRFRSADSSGQVSAATQRFYPFAAGGPLVFNPAGQVIEGHYGDRRLNAGWFGVPDSVVWVLEEHGLPSLQEGVVSPASLPADGVDARLVWAFAAALLVGGAVMLTLRQTSQDPPPGGG
jgi:hypothetical protein